MTKTKVLKTVAAIGSGTLFGLALVYGWKLIIGAVIWFLVCVAIDAATDPKPDGHGDGENTDGTSRR